MINNMIVAIGFRGRNLPCVYCMDTTDDIIIIVTIILLLLKKHTKTGLCVWGGGGGGGEGEVGTRQTTKNKNIDTVSKSKCINVY